MRMTSIKSEREISAQRIKKIFILIAAGIIVITSRLVYLQAIFPNTKLDAEKASETIYLPGYKVKAWEEAEDSKSSIRKAFSMIRKYALSSDEESLYEKSLGRRNKKYVHLMPYVRQEIDKTKHPIETVIHERGKIISSDGVILAGNETIYDIAFLRKNFPSDPKLRDEQIDKTLSILGIDKSYRLNKKSRSIEERLKKSGNWIAAGTADHEQYLKLRKLKFDAIDYAPKLSRSHPGKLAEDTLGIANYRNNDRKNEFIGLSGLEKKYEEDLRSREEEIDTQENPDLVLTGTDENAPRNLHITIDSTLQAAAQEIMVEWNKKIKPELGMILVQETATGRMLAMATTKPTPGQNLFVENAYEPGSTLKTVSFAALIDSNSAKETDTIPVGAGKSQPWQLTKKFFIRDDHDHPEETNPTLSRIIETSSNIGTGKFIKTRMGAEKFYPYLEAFGFGKRTEIELPGESAGTLHGLKRYKSDTTLLVTSSYGHGLSVTPVQLVSAYSALINGGIYNRPRLVDRIALRDGRSEYIAENTDQRRVIKEETSKKVRKVLRGVMENGTGKDTKVKGYILAGKTGTAMRVSRSGKYMEGVNNALFAGFFPYKNPKYTILVIFEHPEKKLHGFGAQSALPAYADMVKKIISIKHIQKDI